MFGYLWALIKGGIIGCLLLFLAVMAFAIFGAFLKSCGY